MQKIIFLFFWFASISVNSQEIVLTGTITDKEGLGIQNASIILLDSNNDNVDYAFTDVKGNYSLSYQKGNLSSLKLEVSCLGYSKTYKLIGVLSQVQNFVLEKKVETLREVVVEANQKIKKEQDTTTIKTASFTNKTEQTLEDVLKKLPGIEVQQDGSIKAHGVAIDKLLIEGEDMFNKNYKLLTKNLDANVLDAVQIIDDYEDNPVLKKLNNSDKVALNLKLKKGKKNIWFGNVTLGAGIVSENRWKESLNLGLIRKEIKLFYLADYNNLGEKATDLVSSNVIENDIFGEDRLEYSAKSLFTINSNEIGLFSKTQSVFNNAFLNSLSFTKKIKKNLSLRGSAYLTIDIQNQNSFAETNYNFGSNPISFTENSFYNRRSSLASTELELKYYPNDKNYITNLFLFKEHPTHTNNNLLFNSNQINQSSKNDNYTFYNHFNHTLQLDRNKVLNNYIYFGYDKMEENTKIFSPLLNSFLEVNSGDAIHQKSNNSLFYIGEKTKLIAQFGNFDITNSLQFEYSKEIFANQFTITEQRFSNYENNLNFNKIKLDFDNALRYNFSKKINFTASLTVKNTNFNTTIGNKNFWIVNPNISLNIKKTGFGNFAVSYSENNDLPEINQLTSNFQLIDYRSFFKGTNFQNPIKNSVSRFTYSIYQDQKRFSVNTGLIYMKSKTILNTISTITNDFNFSSSLLTPGGDNFNFNFSVVNYLRKLKLASKIETIQNWNSTPISVNSDVFLISKNYSNTIKYTATTYFKKGINLDGGFAYHFNKSEFDSSTNENNTKDIFLNLNVDISKVLLAECKSASYFVNSQNYTFSNLVLNYNPEQSRFSYRLVFNNMFNEDKFTFVTLNNFTFYQSSVDLVPRYLLGTVKYRF